MCQGYRAAAFPSGAFRCMFTGSPDFVELDLEVGDCGGPIVCHRVLPIVEEISIENVGGVHLPDEMDALVFVGDDDLKIRAFDLALVELPCVGGDVGVGRLDQRCGKADLDGKLLRVRDLVPRAQLV